MLFGRRAGGGARQSKMRGFLICAALLLAEAQAFFLAPSAAAVRPGARQWAGRPSLSLGARRRKDEDAEPAESGAEGDEGAVDGEAEGDEEPGLPADWHYDGPQYTFEKTMEGGPDIKEGSFQLERGGMVRTSMVSGLGVKDEWEEDEDLAHMYTSADDFPYPVENPTQRGFVVMVTGPGEEDKAAAESIAYRMNDEFGDRVQVTHHRFDGLPLDTYRGFPEELEGSEDFFEIWFEGWEGKLMFSRNAMREDKRRPTEEEVEQMVSDVRAFTSDDAYKHMNANRVEGI